MASLTLKASLESTTGVSRGRRPARIRLPMTTHSATTLNQWRTLVHFPAQPKPCWSVSRIVSSLCRVMDHLSTEVTQRIPKTVLTLSRKVDECTHLP